MVGKGKTEQPCLDTAISNVHVQANDVGRKGGSSLRFSLLIKRQRKYLVKGFFHNKDACYDLSNVLSAELPSLLILAGDS